MAETKTETTEAEGIVKDAIFDRLDRMGEAVRELAGVAGLPEARRQAIRDLTTHGEATE